MILHNFSKNLIQILGVDSFNFGVIREDERKQRTKIGVGSRKGVLRQAGAGVRND